MRNRQKTMRSFRLFLFLFATVCIIGVSFFLFQKSMKPIVKTFALTKANNLTTVTVNNTINEILSSGDFHYDDLVSIEYDSQGKISAVKTDSIAMNMLKTVVSVKISEAVSSIEKTSLSIPMGTLTGSAFMTGLGPEINIRTSLSCSCAIEVKNSFEYSGINQTLHKILLEVTAFVYVIAMGESVSTQVFTAIPVAQTVIIGDIPEIYAGADDTLWQDLIE